MRNRIAALADLIRSSVVRYIRLQDRGKVGGTDLKIICQIDNEDEKAFQFAVTKDGEPLKTEDVTLTDLATMAFLFCFHLSSFSYSLALFLKT